MTKTAKRQLKKNNTKKMKGGGLFGNAPVAPSSETEPKTQESTSTVFSKIKNFFTGNKKSESNTQQPNTQQPNTQQQTGEISEPPTHFGGRRRNTKKATRKAKKGGRIAKKGARKANKSRRTRK